MKGFIIGMIMLAIFIASLFLADPILKHREYIAGIRELRRRAGYRKP